MDGWLDWFSGIFNAKRTRVKKKNKSKAIAFKHNNKKIDFLLNDMSTPNFRKIMDKPNLESNLKFTVGQFKGGGYQPHQVEFQAANCYVAVTNTLNYMNKMTSKPLTRWAGSGNLQILPRAGGNDINAFYNRRTLSFFHFTHKRLGGSIYTSNSADVISHELGHALLDSWRPDTWGKLSVEIFGFHEAFADFTSLVHALTYREVIERVLKETKGDLRKENMISKIAEEVGISIYKLVGPSHGHSGKSLRSAINNFNYVNPSKLPKKGRHDQLLAEPHSFGRIFLGAFYEMLVMIYEDVKSTKKWNDVNSLAIARDTLTRYVLNSVHNAPLNTRFFSSFAKTMLWSDVTLGNRKYHDRMQKIFFDRNILQPTLSMLAAAPKCDNESKIMMNDDSETVKLNQYFLRSQSDNPLYALEVELASQSAYLYDNNNQPIDLIRVDRNQALEDLSDTMEYLHLANQVSDDSKTPFSIDNGKLVRTCFPRSDFELQILPTE